jgi:hypothetical protein
MGARADQAFNEADQGAAVIFVPAIVLADLYYMNVNKDAVLLDYAGQEDPNEPVVGLVSSRRST